MTFAFIAERVGEWPVAWMCDALDVSESGYHAWAARTPSPAEQRRGELWPRSRRSTPMSGVGTAVHG